MLEGLYSAAAGLAAQQQRMDALGNDVANVSTTGYKRVRIGFRDLLYQQASGGAGADVLTGAGTATEIAGRSHAQGTLVPTGDPLDVGIEGEGFLQVRRADGTLALTRDGALQFDGQGRLATKSGLLLQPAIALPSGVAGSDVAIGSDGTVTAAGRPIGRIALVTVTAAQRLQSVGESLFVATPESGPTRAATGSRLVAGNLEGSNVDVAEAMVDMMDAQRGFQLASRAISTQDQMLEIANGVKR